jgi:hypothetical protein
MWKIRTVCVGAALSCGLLGLGGTPASAAPRPPAPRVDGTESVLRAVPPVARAAPAKRAGGLTSWTGSLALKGKTYPYTMLGSDPAAGSKTTKLRVRIIPLSLTFEDGGATLDPTDLVDDIVASPIFKRADYRSGHTQYGDAMQRAQFWDRVQTTSPQYHVLVSKPKVLTTAFLRVPADGGFSFDTANGPAGLVHTSYLLSLLPLLDGYYDPNAVLMIVVKDVQGDDFLGFHFSYTPGGNTVPQTLIWTGYFTPNVLVGASRSDVYVMSHEIAEWINDPYLTNTLPAWKDPASGVCFNNLLEVADPVEFLPRHSFEVAVKRRVFHVTDVAGISWFAHDVPSRELGGAYSYDGNLRSFSELCA